MVESTGQRCSFFELNRLIQRGYRITEFLIEVAEEFDFDACKPLRYAGVVGDDAVAFGLHGKLVHIAREYLTRHTLTNPVLGKQHVEEHVEHQTALKEFDMSVNISADGKLLDNFRGNDVEDLAYILKSVN